MKNFIIKITREMFIAKSQAPAASAAAAMAVQFFVSEA